MKLIAHILAVVMLALLLRGAEAAAQSPDSAKPVAVWSAPQPKFRGEKSPALLPPLPPLPPLPKLPYSFSAQLLEDDKVPAPLLPPRKVRLLFAGDVMQHIPQVTAARRTDGSFDYGPSFAYVKPLFEQADLAIVNLETTLTASSDYTGYPCFRSPVALADALREAGVGVCVLANNHCCDGGARGIRTTLAELDRCGVAHTGVFADSAGYRARHPLSLDVSGLRIALFNYTYGTNGISVPKGMIVNRIDTAVMARDLGLARREAYDCVVVFVHWGNEYERQANAEQRRLAEFLRRHGADIVVGSHPHVVQPFEADASGVVFYSLGNFVSNQRTRYCDGGLMADVRITQRSDGEMYYDAGGIPVWVRLPGYHILPPQAADTLLMQVWERAHYDRFIGDTHHLLYQ